MSLVSLMSLAGNDAWSGYEKLHTDKQYHQRSDIYTVNTHVLSFVMLLILIKI